MSRYKWVYCPAGCLGHPAPSGSMNPEYYTRRLFDVGIEVDGSLHNPNGYPDDIVRTAIEAAEARRHQRRSEATKEAAATRRRRQQQRINSAALALAAGKSIGPRSSCYVCGRGLDDPQSVARGIGSECWQDVLRFMELAAASRINSRPAQRNGAHDV